MGWWNMNATGGVSTKKTRAVMGDSPANIMDLTISNIVKEYERAWKRKPTKKELKGCFDFCTNCYYRANEK